MQKIFLVLFILSLAIAQVYSQQRTYVGKTIFSDPDVYQPPSGPDGTIQIRSTNGSSSKSIFSWVVYSDRLYNPVFSDDKLTTKSGEINFLDAFYVINENPTAVEIIKYNPEVIDLNNRKIIKEPVYIGWVEKSKMLLWRNSLISSKTKFTKKALTIHSIEALSKPGEYIENNSVKLFDSPSFSEKTRNANKLRLFNFLFVFKEEGDKYLIGKKETFYPSEARTIILGWVPKGIVQIWDQRMCLIPNNDQISVKERMNSSKFACVFDSKQEAADYAKSQLPVTDPEIEKQILWKEANPSTGYSGEWKRYPILGDVKGDVNNIITTGYVSQIVDANGAPVVSVDQQNIYNKKFNDQLPRSNKINVVFVIDGTGSMQPYFSYIKQSIDSTTEKLLAYSARTDRQINYGVVVYRDYAHEKCPLGDRSIQLLEITSNRTEVTEFLDKVSKESAECGVDKDLPEALYKGLHNAVNLFNKKDIEKETNILIILGDAGNHLEHPQNKNYPIQNIINKAASLNCSIFALRVADGNDDTYLDYKNQLYYFIKKTALKVDQTLNGGKPVEPNFTEKSGSEFVLKSGGRLPIEGVILLNESGKRYDPELLSSKISNFIKDQNNNVDLTIDQSISKIEGAGQKNMPVSPRMRLLFKNAGIDPDDPTYKQFLSDINYQWFITAYAPYQANGLSKPLYEYQLFVNQGEYERLKDALATLVSGSGNPRDNLYNAYLQILRTHYGGVETAQLVKMNQNSFLSTIQEMVTGINAQNELFQKYKLRDLTNESIVENKDIYAINDLVHSKIKLLQSLETDPRYTTIISGNRYYWIPQDYLP